MAHNNSPINKDSFSQDASGYDAEAILNNHSSETYRQPPVTAAEPQDRQTSQPLPVEQPVPDTAPAPEPLPDPAPAPFTNQQSSPHRRHLETEKAMGIISDSRTVLFIGLVLLVAAIYALIVSVSYFRTLGRDQSAVLNDEFAPELISNTGGPFGAWLSNMLIHDWLGVGAFIIIVYIGTCGLMMLNVFKTDFWKLTFRSLLCAAAVSIIGGFITVNLASPVYWGGMHGHLLNERLILISGIWGALAVSVIMAGLVGLLFFKQLKSFFGLMNQGIQAFRLRRARRRAERLQREEEENRIRSEEEARKAELVAMEDERRKAELALATAKARAEAEAAEMERRRIEAEAAMSMPNAMPNSSNQEVSEEKSGLSEENDVKEIPAVHEAYMPEEKPILSVESERIQAATPLMHSEISQPNPVEDVERQETEKDLFDAENMEENVVVESESVQRPLFAGETFDEEKSAESATPTPVEVKSEENTQRNECERPLFSEPAAAQLNVRDDRPQEPVSHSSSDTDTINEPMEDVIINQRTDDELFAEPDNQVEAVSQKDTVISESETPLPTPVPGSLDTLYDPRADLSHFRFPSIDILPEAEEDPHGYNKEMLEENMSRITKTLSDYNINIQSIEATVGPTVILYEIVPAEGVRVARVKSLEDDLALKLAAVGVRIIAPMPGRGTIGIEVPREDPQTVSMRSVIDSPEFRDSNMELPMAIGRTVSNQVFVKDLAKMPHLLVAGATGMGKSVGLNAIIASLLYKKHPAELKFVLVDPKQVEFSIYAKLERHYLAKLPDEEEPVIVDPAKAIATLNSLCVEMENRYALLKKADMRNIKDYNYRFVHRQLNPNDGHKFLPYIVVIVDEFADLIMMAGKEIETPIARIAQKARAVGIHMIIATQRPSTNVITGLIKANFPGRIAFRVFQMVDSRTILDRPGANQLIGRGDLLFSNNGKVDRVQCAFIDTPEVLEICRQISTQTGYPMAYELPEYTEEGGDNSGAQGGRMASLSDRDQLFEECARHVVSANLASTSALQRHYSIGFNRAGKIMDQMEAVGIVGPAQGGKPRQVLVDMIGLESILASI